MKAQQQAFMAAGTMEMSDDDSDDEASAGQDDKDQDLDLDDEDEMMMEDEPSYVGPGPARDASRQGGSAAGGLGAGLGRPRLGMFGAVGDGECVVCRGKSAEGAPLCRLAHVGVCACLAMALSDQKSWNEVSCNQYLGNLQCV